MSFDIEVLRRNTNAQVRLLLGSTELVVGFLSGQFGIDGSSEYGSMFETDRADMVNKAITTLNAAGGSSIPQMKSQISTMATWSGTGRLSFSVNVLLINIRDGDDQRWSVMENVKRIQPSIFPNIGDGIAGALTMSPPRNYSPDIGSTPKRGVHILYVGKFIRIPDLIVKSVNTQFSQETFPSGTPIHATMTLGLETYKMPSSGDVVSYFQK
jgi:hypothetical protein